ncbi:MAG TPA: aspartate-semialdehyde dehydrogenase [Dehalococcoidia bacterium]|nr:aspartate-semialdehyde dehydrogenase [Dehalococcoidia bacterium]
MSAREFNVAIVGASGAVGPVLLEVLNERRFPVKQLKLLATARSAGKRMRFGGDELVVEETSDEALRDVDFAFISANDDASRRWAPVVVEGGGVVIDDGGAFRMEPNVPLIVPEVNGDDLEGHEGIVSIPNCTTTPLVMVLSAIQKANPLRRVIVDSYQSVTGTGAQASVELERQTREVLDGATEVTASEYPHPIAFNVIPQVAGFLESGYTGEEWKIIQESRKILHLPELRISATCVRVPVFVTHSEAVHVELEREMSAQEVREVLGQQPGIVVQDDPAAKLYPMPLTAAGKDDVFVGRIRKDESCPAGIALWLACDNLRKGAATNSVQIAEEMIARNLV